MLQFGGSRPPLSSGSGRGPLKAETWVRVPLGAYFFMGKNVKLFSFLQFAQAWVQDVADCIPHQIPAQNEQN
jgi:hypothetical protein